jgi:hypothetical protein
MLGVGLHRIDQYRHQIQAPLVDVLDLGLRAVNGFDGVMVTIGEGCWACLSATPALPRSSSAG